MSKKIDIRKQLEAGMALYLSQGKQITKLPTYGSKRQRKEPKEEIVEIEIDFLPEALRKKHFGE